MRLMSPPPRRNPAALENVGAAVTAVAANAPRRARRVIPEELLPAMYTVPSSAYVSVMLHGHFISSPDATFLLHRRFGEPSVESPNVVLGAVFGDFLRSSCQAVREVSELPG